MSEPSPALLTDYRHLKSESLLQAWREAGSSAVRVLHDQRRGAVIVTSQASAYFRRARTTLARLSAASREVKPDSPEGHEVESRRQIYEAIVYRELGINTVALPARERAVRPAGGRRVRTDSARTHTFGGAKR